METITYAHIQELVKRLPATKLPIAYHLLSNLAAEETDIPSPQLDFMLLSISERRRIMVQQAERMVAYYKQTAEDRQEWQAGEFNDEY